MKRMRHAALAASFLILAGSATVRAQSAEDHANLPLKTVAISPTRVSPQDLTMGTGDVLAFQNFSQRLMKLTFIQPKNVGQYTTCTHLKRVSPNEALAPGALFQRQGDEVTALISPGTFVSVCSLKPGLYVYTAVDALGSDPDDTLGIKGTITVK